MKSEIKKIKFTRIILLCLMGLFCFVATADLYAQGTNRIEVTGVVKDDFGETVIGASVVAKGASVGSITDLDGRYKLLAPAKGTLVVTFIGFSKQEIAINGRTNINVSLKEDAELLDEVVVIGYGSVKKDDLTGSVVAIKAEEMNKGAVTSPQELIQGKVPGVFIQPGNGAPGSGSTIRVRSGASLNASNDPLIVIDGVPVGNDAAPGMGNALASINPSDIDTFTVLKDASATAIYGSRASNGVILITTKKGTKEKLKISYSSTYSINDPYKKIKTLNGTEFREVITKNYGTNKEVMDQLNMFPDVSTDWQKEIFHTAFSTDQNLSVAGNALNTPFRVSFGYNNTDGTLRNSNFERYTLDLSANPKFFNDHLTVNLNVKGSINKNKYGNTGAIGAAAFYDPTKPIHNETGDFNGYWNWVNKAGEPNSISSGNPVASIYDRSDNGKIKRSMGNIQFDYKVHFLPELRLNLNLGYDVSKGTGDKGPNENSFDAMKDPDFKGIGRRESWDHFRRNSLIEYYMSYDKELPKLESRLSAMGGYSWQRFYYSNFSKNYSYIQPNSKAQDADKWVTDTDRGEFIKVGDRKIPGENYLVSFYGRFNYVFRDRYLVTATLRGDGSSKFAKGNRWGVFPSVAAAWTITGEDFMKNMTSVSSLKLRLGFGRTGQQDMSDYEYVERYLISTSPDSNYLNEFLMKPGKSNPDLKWETTDTYNVAVDYGFWNNRITGSLEYYKKKTKDLLSIVDAPAGTAFSNKKWANIGNMENDGVEFNINAVAIDTKDWGWNVGFNATWNKSKITKLTENGNDSFTGINEGFAGIGTGSYVQKQMVGYSPRTFYMYQQVYDENGKPIQNAFVDRNGDGQITEADRYLSHNPAPKFYLGFSSTVRYKQFDLGFNMRANLGNYMYNDVAAMNSTIAGAHGGQGFLTNLYKEIYDTNFNLINSSEQSKSDYFFENASFLKMDNITLGYSFNNLFKTKLSGRLSFAVQNVFTITNYSGLDPESAGGNFGIDKDIWPRPRTYTFGVSLNF